MTKINLTDEFVGKAETEAGSDRTIFWDRNLRRFGLMVTKNRSKSFIVQYLNAARKSARMKIGAPPELKVAEARTKALGILGDVTKGADPLNDKREQVKKAETASKNTLVKITENYFRRAGKDLRSGERRRKVIERLVLPVMGSREISSIKRSEIVKMLDDIEDNNGPVQADAVLAFIRAIMAWHASRVDNFNSPIARKMSRTKPKDRARKRTLSDQELRAVWRASQDMGSPIAALVPLLALTGCRLREIAWARWAELDKAGEELTIAGARYKTKIDHLIPLPKLAQEIIAAMPRIAGCDYLFPGRHQRRPIDGMSHYKQRIDVLSGVRDWTWHDLRRTARSLMSRAGVSGDIGEKCLGHVPGLIRGTYDRYSYYVEKKEAFVKLAGLIAVILDLPPTDNVIDFPQAANS